MNFQQQKFKLWHINIRMSVVLFTACCSIGSNVFGVTASNISKHYVFPLTNVDIIVKGVVKDKDGPLPGVSITLKSDPKIGTISDVNGKYSINIPENGTLVFNAIGYKSVELAAHQRSILNLVTMEENVSSLNEIVVLGYSSKQLSNISGSVSVVSNEELNDVTSNNLASLLQGKVAGVIVSNGSGGDPNSSGTPIIRGSSSISAGSSPLYVVDGIIGGNANPNDIESVTVLKDAAVTGLYGSRAANGVIIITTKSGKAGKSEINFSSNAGINEKTTGGFEIMNSQQLYDYQKLFMSPVDFTRERPSSLLLQNTNWIDLAFRTGITQDNTLSYSGGTEKTQIYTSANYYKEQGTLRHNGLDKYTFRANISHHISEKLKLNIQLNSDFGKYEREASGNSGALYGAFTNVPWDNPYNPDGSIRLGIESGWIGRENTNFLHAWQYNFGNTKQSAVTGDINLTYKISPKLTFSTFNRASYDHSKNVLYYDVQSKSGKPTNGSLSNIFNNNSALITSNRLDYKQNFGRHNFNLLAVVEGEKNYFDNNSIMGQGLPPSLAVMSVSSRILTAGGNTVENYYGKGLVQVDYDYNNRYFAAATFVNETSSRFGADNRSANFYTLSGAWLLSNEQFMKNQSIFDQVKVRASYGSTGNAQIDNYQSLGLYTYSFQYAGFSAAMPTQLANSNLTWEKAKTTNLGFDIGMFKRISMNIDLYDKTTNALLLNVPLPYTSGYSSIMENVGSIQNRGLEINLNTDNLKGSLKWETSFNIAFNRNKVLRLNQGKSMIIGNQSISVGHDLNSWYMRSWSGVDQQNGDPLWEKVTTGVDGKTTISTTNSYSGANLQFVGSASPTFTGGVMNTFSYKGLSLKAFFNFVNGNQVYHNTREFFDSDGSYQTYNSMVLKDDWNRWQKPGDIATHPKSITAGNKLSNRPSSRYLEDGSYIRLRNITFSYQLPQSILSKVKLADVRVFVSGDNLWTGTRFSGMDPEVLLGPGGGTSSNKYPISKKGLFGINIKI